MHARSGEANKTEAEGRQVRRIDSNLQVGLLVCNDTARPCRGISVLRLMPRFSLFMNTSRWARIGLILGTFLVGGVSLLAQGPGGPGPGGAGQDVKLIPQFDRNGNQRLDAAERQAARDYLAAEKAAGRGPRRPGPRGRAPASEKPAPGPKLSPADVKKYPDAALYDPTVVRTLFLEFPSPDWERELADFYHTDVDVPATVTVDGRKLADVGVHFRGASSFFTVGEGRKRSLNLSLDSVHEEQRLGGYRTLNLLNSHTDPTFVRTILYDQIARQLLPAPQANYVRVVINGESWGPYVNVQQFNKDFVRDWFGTTDGARWKVPGSPRGRGGLTYLGSDPAEYQRIYEIKTKDKPESWTALIELCRVLNQTPIAKLESELPAHLNVDGALRFLALENVFINSDGYWIRTSDYNLYRDVNGRFHLIPHDSNETFRAPMGPGASGEGVGLDPFTGADDPEKPLLSRLLAVPAWRQQYLAYVRALAETWLDWKKLSPIIEQHQALISGDIPGDTRKLYSAEAFRKAVVEETEEPGFRGPQRSGSLKDFVEQRQAYLLGLPAVKSAPKVELRPPVRGK